MQGIVREYAHKSLGYLRPVEIARGLVAEAPYVLDIVHIGAHLGIQSPLKPTLEMRLRLPVLVLWHTCWATIPQQWCVVGHETCCSRFVLPARQRGRKQMCDWRANGSLRSCFRVHAQWRSAAARAAPRTRTTRWRTCWRGCSRTAPPPASRPCPSLRCRCCTATSCRLMR